VPNWNLLTQDILDEKPSPLYEQTLPDSPSTLLSIYRLILSLQPLLSDSLHARVLLQLGTLSTRLKTTKLRARYVDIVNLALNIECFPTSFAPIFSSISQWVDTNDKQLRQASNDVVSRVNTATAETRVEFWWALRDQADLFRVSEHAPEIAFLLTPIAPRISFSTVRSLIALETRDRWRQESVNAGHRGEHILELLDERAALPHVKRKRSDGNAIELLRRLPTMEGDVEDGVASLTNYVQS
jgi:hypothetical protein